MKLALLAVSFSLSSAAVVKVAPAATPGAQQASKNAVGAKQVGDSKSGRIGEFIASMQNRVGQVQSRAQVAKAGQQPKKSAPSGNKLSRKQRKAVQKAAKKDARNRVRQEDPEAEEVLSASGSLSIERVRRHTDHFSFSESEHYRDCSTTSSSSSSHGKKCKKDKKKKKEGYRLRHTRVHIEESRSRRNEFSASASGSIDLGEFDVSASLSASEERSRRRCTVLKCCEDELSRRRKDCNYGQQQQQPYGCYDPYARVDYRKKVFYHDDAERRFSGSLSASISVDVEEPVTVTVGGGAPTAKP